MSAFGGLILTNKGRILQAKAQTGIQLNFTRIAVGDGELGSSSILDMKALKHQIKSLEITKIQVLTDGKAKLGCILRNENLQEGFYWREMGIFAQDPDLGEILYCYGNSGVNSEYIPATGGADIIEKQIDIVTIVGNATNVSATLNSSIQVSSVNGQTGEVVLKASDVGAVPTVRTVNKKDLSKDITLSATDINTADGKTLEEFKTSTIASLDKKANLVDGKVTIEELPPMDFIPTSEKGVASGVATLDSNGKISDNFLNAQTIVPSDNIIMRVDIPDGYAFRETASDQLFYFTVKYGGRYRVKVKNTTNQTGTTTVTALNASRSDEVLGQVSGSTTYTSPPTKYISFDTNYIPPGDTLKIKVNSAYTVTIYDLHVAGTKGYYVEDSYVKQEGSSLVAI